MRIHLKTYFCYIVYAAALLFSASAVGQFTIPPKPTKQSEQKPLHDYINLLSPTQQTALEQKLLRYADSTSTQIVIAIISSSNGDDLGLIGAKWLSDWGIGQADEDNGILIILAKDDRQIDINTGYGIEYRMSDRMAEQIINRIIIPQFKSENYYAGLDQGADAIFKALQGEFTEDRNFDDGISMQQIVMIFLIFLVIMMILRRRNKGNGNNNGSGGSGGSLLDVIILSNMGRTGGFGGSGSFGGGFGSGGGFGGGFGGGMGGGGGASGSW